MRISDWSSDVCSSDLLHTQRNITFYTLQGILADYRAHFGIQLHAILDVQRLGSLPQHRHDFLAHVAHHDGNGNGHATFAGRAVGRSEEHTSELQSLMRISYAVFCLTKKKNQHKPHTSPR